MTWTVWRCVCYSDAMGERAVSNRVLVVDDDQRLCTFLNRYLSEEGFFVEIAHEGSRMQRALADHEFSLVLLDLAFPKGEDGMTLARRIRSQYDCPLIIVSAKSATIDKVVCLELGADDYVTKPFEPRELLARIRTVMRRYGRSKPPEGEDGGRVDGLSFRGWHIDPQKCLLMSPRGEPTRLTGREFDVLLALVERRGRVLSREQILDIVAHRHWNPYDRSVDVLISKLRRKLHNQSGDSSFIKTVRGVGYAFVPSDVSAGATGR